MNCGRSRVASSLRSGFVQPAVKAITATKNVNMMIYLLFLISVIDKLLQRYAFLSKNRTLFPFFTSFSCLFVRLFANDGLQQRHVHLQTGIILLVPLDDGRDMQQCIEEIAGSGQLEDYSVF